MRPTRPSFGRNDHFRERLDAMINMSNPLVKAVEGDGLNGDFVKRLMHAIWLALTEITHDIVDGIGNIVCNGLPSGDGITSF